LVLKERKGVYLEVEVFFLFRAAMIAAMIATIIIATTVP
jgi:hypothetical protein